MSSFLLMFLHNTLQTSYDIVGKKSNIFPRDWMLIEFCISFFMIKYSKFTDNIGSANFTDTFCQNTDRFKKSGGYYTPSPSPHSARPWVQGLFYFAVKILQFHRKTPVLESLFDKVAGPQSCNFIKKRLQHRFFLVNIKKI